jgi:hypothetical protein
MQVKNIKTFTIWFSILLISALTLNNSIFLHVHKLESGNIISHAHPFQKSAEKQTPVSHNHTANEIQLYQILSDLTLVLFFVLGFSIIVLSRPVSRLISEIEFISKKTISELKIRPPPAYSIV